MKAPATRTTAAPIAKSRCALLEDPSATPVAVNTPAVMTKSGVNSGTRSLNPTRLDAYAKRDQWPLGSTRLSGSSMQ